MQKIGSNSMVIIEKIRVFTTMDIKVTLFHNIFLKKDGNEFLTIISINGFE
jgi:hypothetical protein